MAGLNWSQVTFFCSDGDAFAAKFQAKDALSVVSSSPCLLKSLAESELFIQKHFASSSESFLHQVLAEPAGHLPSSFLAAGAFLAASSLFLSSSSSFLSSAVSDLTLALRS